MVYRSEPLQRPARPVLPPVSADELQCLSKDVYQRLQTRQRERRQYCEELETIIDSTREPGH